MRNTKVALLAVTFSLVAGCFGNVERESTSTPTPDPTIGAGDPTAPAVEASAVDTGPAVEDCPTPDIRDFTPSWKAPAPFHQGKCSATQVEALASCNFDDSADQTACAAVVKDPAN